MALSDPPAPPNPTFWDSALEDLAEIGHVRAHFEESGTAAERWLLEGSPVDVDDITGVLEEIAVGLGYPDGPHAWVDVLNTLRRESSHFRYGGELTIFENIRDSAAGRYGKIENLTKVVTSFCRKLRRESKKIARLKDERHKELAPSNDQLPPVETEEQRRDAFQKKLARVRRDTDEPLPFNADFWKASKEYQDRKTFINWLKQGPAGSEPAHQAFCRLLLLPSTEFVAARRLWKKKPKRARQKKIATD